MGILNWRALNSIAAYQGRLLSTDSLKKKQTGIPKKGGGYT